MGGTRRIAPQAIWTVVLVVVVSAQRNDPGDLDRLPAAALPRDPPTDFGTSYRVSYNEVAGSSRRFPDASNISQSNLEYFGDRLDFDSISGSILIGAADKLYLMNSDLVVAEGNELMWEPEQENRAMCNETYSDERERSYICRNHIRLYESHPMEPDLLYVCGSQADTIQMCRGVPIVSSGLGSNPEMPTATSTSIISTHPDYGSFGEFRRLNPNDTNYISWTYREARTFDHMFNEQSVSYDETFTNSEEFEFRREWLSTTGAVRLIDLISTSFDPSQFDEPAPVVEGENYNFYFLFLREVHEFSLEQSDPAPTILSQVVRICRDDPGVLLEDNTNGFSTFLKAQIFCDQSPSGSVNNPAGAVTIRYNDLWSVALNGDRGGRISHILDYDRVLYGAFSTAITGPTASVICVYRATPFDGSENDNRGLFDIFTEDLEVTTGTMARENSFPFCDGNGRPSVNENGVSAEDTVISGTMEQLVTVPDPLIVLDNVYITQMVVDEVCVVTISDRSACLNQDVIFAGTDQGTIYKIVMTQNLLDAERTTPVIVEEISLDDKSHVKELRLEELGGEKYLYAVTNSHVYKLALERCSRHMGLADCVGSRDPYCVWDAMADRCQRTTLTAFRMNAGTVPQNLQQNISSGVLSQLLGVGFDSPTYSVEEGTMLDITIVSNGTVPPGWVELRILNSDGSSVSDPQPLSFSNRTTVSIPIPSDSVYTGVQELRVVLSNTEQGMAFFTRQQTSVRVIDDDGILAQVGLVALDDTCIPWRSRFRVPRPSLPLLDDAILEGLDRKDLIIESNSINCSTQQALLNVAIYRFTITSITPNIDTAKLRDDLEAWVETMEEVKVDRDTTVTIEPGCNTRIFTLEDDLCVFQQVPPGGIAGGTEGQGVASVAAAVVLGVLFVCAVALCVVLLVALWWSKQKGSFDINDCEVPNGTKQPNTVSPEHTYDVANNTTTVTTENANETKKDLTASHSSSDSSHSQLSPSLAPVNSAAPLVRDGVESKKNPFQFNLQNPPFGRKDSPRVSRDTPVRMSQDSPRVSVVDSGSVHRNSRDNTTAF